MDTFIQQIINGLVLGSVYALVALGYTMVYGIINLINFAHGEVLMVGALTSWTVVVSLENAGLPGWLLLLISLIAAVSDSSSSAQPGIVPSSPVTTVQLVSAPTISTSPCAKLIRLMMPYTIV